MKINLCSQVLKQDGFIKVDHLALPNVDFVHDLNTSPWPFADESVEHIRAYNILEALSNSIQAIEEIWRILKPGGKLEICLPYYNNNWSCVSQDLNDIIYRHSSLNYYRKCGFKLVQIVIPDINIFLSVIPNRALRFLAYNFAIIDGATVVLRKPPVESTEEI